MVIEKCILSFLIFLSFLNCFKSESCDDFKVKNAYVSDCEQITDFIFNVTVKCNNGYEIQPNINTVNLLTGFDFYDLVQCNVIGCPIAAIPNQRILDQNNLVIGKIFCVRTDINGYCRPDRSYVDLNCKKGYIQEERYGPLKVKCSTNHSWAPLPFCSDGELPVQITDSVYYFLSDKYTEPPIFTDEITEKLTMTSPTTSLPTTPIALTSKTDSNLILETLKSNPPVTNPSCSQNYPKPKNFQSDKTVLNLILHANSLLYEVGSYVKYTCQPGYYVLNVKSNLTTTCQSNSLWTSIAECEKLPCWDKLPKKPLNGERTATLLLSKLNSSTDGTSVNFTCDPYFELVGNGRMTCKNGQWDSSPPVCRLLNTTCSKKPPTEIGKAKLISLQHVELKAEKSFNTFENVTLYINAGYTCPDNKFKTNHTIKYTNNKVAYIDSLCVGRESWQIVVCG